MVIFKKSLATLPTFPKNIKTWHHNFTGDCLSGKAITPEQIGHKVTI